MSVVCRLAVGQQEVRVIFEPPRGGDLWFELPQRAGGGVAWVGETRESFLVAVGVEAFESPAPHDGFAADLECRQRRLHPQWKRSDGASVLGHVFAGGSIAARDGIG